MEIHSWTILTYTPEWIDRLLKMKINCRYQIVQFHVVFPSNEKKVYGENQYTSDRTGITSWKQNEEFWSIKLVTILFTVGWVKRTGTPCAGGFE